MTDLTEDTVFQKLLDRVLERLHAGLEVDIDGMGIVNEVYRQALRQAVANWLALHAAPLGGSRRARAQNLLYKHPEFDGYRLLKPLGKGGCSVVFRAQDIEAAKVVGEDAVDLTYRAIKVFTSGVSDSTLKKELVSLMSLSKARCVPEIYRAGEIDGFPYLAMQLIEGKTLVDLLPADEKLAPPERCRVLITAICGALAEVADHVSTSRGGQELVHGDIKPPNIIVSNGGKITILDFSIAMLRSPEQGVPGENTMSSATGLTKRYASPEMLIRNSMERITPASDIFQVGLLAYRMMTGKDYWYVPSHERRKLLVGHPDSRLVRVVERALDWQPARRFPSACKMHDALRSKPFLGRLANTAGKKAFWIPAVMALAGITVGWLAHSRRADVQKSEIQAELKESRREVGALQRAKAELQDRVDILVRKIASPTRGVGKPYDQRLSNIRVRYDRIRNGTAAEDDLAGLEEDCRGFMEDFPSDPLARNVVAIGTWIHDARTKGVIRVEPVEFKENAYWDTATMRYRIGLRGVPWDDTRGIVTYVKTVDHTADLTGKPLFETPWRPKERIDVLVRAWEKEGVDHFSLDGDGEILKSKEDVIEKSLRTSGDDDFTFRFRIKRIGFGPIPERP